MSNLINFRQKIFLQNISQNSKQTKERYVHQNFLSKSYSLTSGMFFSCFAPKCSSALGVFNKSLCRNGGVLAAIGKKGRLDSDTLNTTVTTGFPVTPCSMARSSGVIMFSLFKFVKSHLLVAHQDSSFLGIPFKQYGKQNC